MEIVNKNIKKSRLEIIQMVSYFERVVVIESLCWN